MARVLVAFLLALFAAPSHPAGQPSPPVQCEVRVFDGGEEVTRATRVRVFPSGKRQSPIAPDANGRFMLAPGLYDVQAIRERNGQVSAIRWLEHLLIERYPDEQGRHLEVVNFKPQYGALELRAGDQVDYDVTAFAAGDRTRPVATALAGSGYMLVVVPAGRYDVRAHPRQAATGDLWLPDIDVPVDRTRLRMIRPPQDVSGWQAQDEPDQPTKTR